MALKSLLPSLSTLGFLSLTLALAACGDKDTSGETGNVQNDDTGVPIGDQDQDGDGYTPEQGDCDDLEASVNPGADEVCDGLDNNCDDVIDDEGGETWYADNDADGYGDAGNSQDACDQPSGFVADATDCDDSDASASPGNVEVCDDIDNDCDGEIDEDESLDAGVWYADGDSDGYGAGDSVVSCDQPTGYVGDDGDCDDADPRFYPGASEDDCTDPNDYNCDGSVAYEDADGDGFAACEECDDSDAAVNPAAVEVCDGIDNDCDGDIDGGALNASTWYADADADGYGDAATSVDACDQPTGYVSDDTDCDDALALVNPAGTEICNDIDDDCDGDIDNGASDASTWYRDGDGDTYGDASLTADSCDQPSGFVADDADCDDADSGINPAATEICDGVDNDCDGTVDNDDAVNATTWYQDNDGDSFGDADNSTEACDQPTGYVGNAADCDDLEAAHNPDADEICDTDDDDCDGSVDESGAIDASTWYADGDSDTYGDADNSMAACDQPSGYVSDDQDCDDALSDAYPGADEYCTDYDNDCDSLIDEDAMDGDYYAVDDDSDGWGAEGSLEWGCSGVLNDLDCDDADASEPMAVVSGDSIQDAIDAALGCVVVGDGTYYEAIDFGGNDVSVTSENGADSTIIDATGLGAPAVTFASGESSDAVLSGFTLTGGEGNYDEDSTSEKSYSDQVVTDYYYTYCGGGIYVDSSSPMLVDLVLDTNILPEATVTTVTDTDGSGAEYTSEYHYTYSYGGGLCILNGSPSMDGVDILANWADQGGGLYVDEYSAVSLSQSWLVSNGATDGGGAQVDGGWLDMTNAASAWNWADGMGGGAYVAGGSLDITNATYNDDATTGGNIYGDKASAVYLMNSIIYGASGSGVEAYGSYSGAFNNVYGNSGGDWVGTAAAGTGSISADPLFVDAAGGDWSLDTGSPSIDAGSPDAAYDDADGTTNDQGAWGGADSMWD